MSPRSGKTHQFPSFEIPFESQDVKEIKFVCFQSLYNIHFKIYDNSSTLYISNLYFGFW